MVMVMVEGDAMLSTCGTTARCWRKWTATYAVDLDDSAKAHPDDHVADSDPDLEDGTDTAQGLDPRGIESANGAHIGDATGSGSTVIGSTAVPALPLVGQLLLALFLMAGGARLYRRRQG